MSFKHGGVHYPAELSLVWFKDRYWPAVRWLVFNQNEHGDSLWTASLVEALRNPSLHPEVRRSQRVPQRAQRGREWVSEDSGMWCFVRQRFPYHAADSADIPWRVWFSASVGFSPPLVYQIKLFLPTFQTIVAFWVQVWSTVFGDDGRGIRTFLIFQLPYNFRNAVKRLWMLKMINYWFKLSLKRGGSGVGGVELDVKGHANLSVRAQAKQYLSSLPAASVRL